MNLPPYKSFEDEDQTLSVRGCFSEFEDDKYKQLAYQDLREQLGCKLLDFLDRFKSPCVVEIVETRKKQYHHPNWYDNRLMEEIIISAKVYNVQYHQVVIPTMDYYGYSNYFEKEKASIKKNIRKIFKGKSK